MTTKTKSRASPAAAAAAGFGASRIPTARAAIVNTDFSTLPPYGKGTLPAGIRSRQIANVNGMTVHILEAGYVTPGRPADFALHGFPAVGDSVAKGFTTLAGGRL